MHQDYGDDCSFTTLVSYDRTGAEKVANMHRKIIFQKRDFPATPLSFYEARTAQNLCQGLGDSYFSKTVEERP